MTHSTRTVNKAFRDAGMYEPDNEMARRIAESMDLSGYPSTHLQDVLGSLPSKSQDMNKPAGAFGS